MKTNKNPYTILNLNTNATKDEIKKAYRKLVVIYHPDKSSDPNALEKFKEIQTAYELLISDNNRFKYDNMSVNQQYEFYDQFKTLISNKYPKFNEYFNYIRKLFFSDETELKNDIETFNFDELYNKIITRLPNVIEKIDFSSFFFNKKIT
jgi:curved DNA-binding protein CbpA